MSQGGAAPRDSLVVQEFLRAYFEDQDAGVELGLGEYQQRFPGHDALIESSWRVLVASASDLPLTALRSSVAIGDELGPYRIERELGHGGQGAVFLAQDTRADRKVAIKVLLAPGGQRDTSLRRFLREAEVASRIQHPGICPIFDFNAEADPPYLVMPYLEGRTLAELVAGQDAPVSPEVIVPLIEKVARALQAAHDERIVHRDVKPANIMVLGSGEPMLLDLGIAQAGDSEAATSLTRTGSKLGTLPYMAPEQVDGEELDARADVHALGVTLFECLTGRLPFDEPTEGRLARAILTSTPPDPRRFAAALPFDLKVVIDTALAKERSHRYQSAAAFADELQRIREHRPILARPAGLALRFRRWFRRDPALASSVCAAFLLLVAGLTTALVLLDRLSDEEAARQETLLQKQEALDEVRRLADFKRLRDLEAEEQTLYPARVVQAEAMRDWLDRAQTLVVRREQHEATHTQLEALLASTDDSARPSDDELSNAWHFEAVADLLGRLETFELTVARVRARLETAQTIAGRTIDEHADDWAACAEELRTRASFAGFELTPQVGLIPLGPDPSSGLFEFYHPESGEPPRRHGVTGRYTFDGASGMVFVLIPGGRFAMGAERPSEQRPAGTPNTDPFAAPITGPIVEAELEPFLLSKFEMTQGQWQRLTGELPSRFGGNDKEDARAPSGFSPYNHPVESISWNDCFEVFGRNELGMPTECQWEYACRAGTTTVWYTGDDVLSLQDFENLADEGTKWIRSDSKPFIPGLDDGFVQHAPVGTLHPNDFGLHDMHGNVMEWCFDNFAPYTTPIRPGDGLREVPYQDRASIRGASYADAAANSTSVVRHTGAREHRGGTVGVRPVFRLR